MSVQPSTRYRLKKIRTCSLLSLFSLRMRHYLHLRTFDVLIFNFLKTQETLIEALLAAYSRLEHSQNAWHNFEAEKLI